MSAIALAHMGDAVYETLVRTWLCVHGTATGKDLHRATIALVCAPAQAEKMQKVLPLLTDEEQAVYKRQRPHHVPQCHPGPVPFCHRFGVFNGLFILKR